MKKLILIYDAGKHLCNVEITIPDGTPQGSHIRTSVILEKVVYNTSYIVGMSYGIVVPEYIQHSNSEDYTQIH